MDKINVGIIGGAGYTGGELLRILINHPFINVAFTHSNSQAGKPVWSTHTDLLGDTDLTFSGTHRLWTRKGLDAIFLCSGHGASVTFMAENEVSDDIAVIDLSADFPSETDDFVYGLPELNRDRIQEAMRIANPGCFASSIQLALLPLAKANLLTDDVQVLLLRAARERDRRWCPQRALRGGTTTYRFTRPSRTSTWPKFARA